MSFDIRDKSVVATYITAGNYGYYSIGLDEYDTDAEPELQAGFVEVGGEIYENTAALAITGWSGISTSTQAYVYIVPGGSTATAIFSSTAPTWSNAKRGWYNSNDRALFAVYKDSAGTGYCHKQELKGRNVTSGGTYVSEITYSTAPTYGDDFIVYEPGVFYGVPDGVNTGSTNYIIVQPKINGTYSHIHAATQDPMTVAYAETGAVYSRAIVLNPGTYRLYANGGTGTPTTTLYRSGRLSNND